MAPALAAATLTEGGTGADVAAASLTATARPAIVTVALRAAPVLAAALMVAVPLPEPLEGLRPTQLAPAVLVVCQLQPDGAVTDTDADPPAAGKAIDVVDTEYVQVGGGAAPVDALNAATVEMVLVSARALFCVRRAGRQPVVRDGRTGQERYPHRAAVRHQRPEEARRILVSVRVRIRRCAAGVGRRRD